MSYVNTSKQIFANTSLGKSFLKENPINLLLIGARDGLNKPWSEFNEDCVHTIGFEPDYIEYEKLLNLKKRNRTYFPNAVWIKKETRPFYIANVPSTSSLFKNNKEVLNLFLEPDPNFRYTKKTKNVECDCLDNLISEDLDIDFISIDTHGAEYEIVKGGENVLSRSFGLVAELWTKEIHKGQKTQGEVLSLLERFGYRVFEFNTFGNWHKKAKKNIEDYCKRELVNYDVLLFKDLKQANTLESVVKTIKSATISDALLFPTQAIYLLNKQLDFDCEKDLLIKVKNTIIENWKFDNTIKGKSFSTYINDMLYKCFKIKIIRS